MKITDRLESNCLIGAIRQGMIMMIPLLVVGYMAAMLVNLPIPAYQDFLSRLLDGHIKDILNSVYGSVNDYFSIFLVLSTSVSFSIKKRKENGIFQSNGSKIILVIITLTALLSYQGIPFDADPSEIFNNMNAFSALLVTLISGELYYALKKLSFFKSKAPKDQYRQRLCRGDRRNRSCRYHHRLLCFITSVVLSWTARKRVTGAYGKHVQCLVTTAAERSGFRTSCDLLDTWIVVLWYTGDFKPDLFPSVFTGSHFQLSDLLCRLLYRTGSSRSKYRRLDYPDFVKRL